MSNLSRPASDAPRPTLEELLLIDIASRVAHRPCGNRPCDKEFPVDPWRWCHGCALAHMQTILAASTAETQRLREMVAMSESRPHEGWQPIETAPNPRQGFTAWDSPEWKNFLVWRPDTQSTYIVARRRRQFVISHRPDWEIITEQLSHWMPLPEAPTAKDSAATLLESQPVVRGVKNKELPSNQALASPAPETETP